MKRRGLSPEDKHREGHEGVCKQSPNRHEVHKVTELEEEGHERCKQGANKVGGEG